MSTDVDGNGGPAPCKKPTLHLGPSRRFTLSDLAAVATGRASLELDVPALEALPTPSPTAPPASPISLPSPSGETLSTAETRAVIIARLASLIQGRASVRREVLEHLTSLLNHPPTPFPSFPKGHEATALLSLLPPTSFTPPLTAAEAHALRTGTYPATGPGTSFSTHPPTHP